jgi:hypothetical protein
MQISPIQTVAQAIQRYTNQTPPAGLVILGRHTPPAAGPEELMGNALPYPAFSLYKGIYGPDGTLKSIDGAGVTFLAKA